MQAKIPLGPALVHEFRGQEHLVLCPGNVSQHRAGREGLVVHVQFLQTLLDDPEGIVGIINGKGRGEAQLLNVPPENAHAGGMEGGRPDVQGLRPDLLFQALFELSRGFVGKGNGNHLPGGGRLYGAEEVGPAGLLLRGVLGLGIPLQEGQVLLGDVVRHFLAVRPLPVAQEVGDAVDKHCGFTAACPCQQEERPFRGQHPFQLPGIHMRKLPGNELSAQGSKACLLFFRKHVDSPCLSMVCLQWAPLYSKRRPLTTRNPPDSPSSPKFRCYRNAFLRFPCYTKTIAEFQERSRIWAEQKNGWFSRKPCYNESVPWPWPWPCGSCWLWPWGSSCWCLPPSLWSSGWEPSGKRMGFGPPFGSPFGRLSPGSCWAWGSDWGLAPWQGGFPCLRSCSARGR